MKNSSVNKSSLAALLLIALFTFGCGSQKADDATITTEIKGKLAINSDTSALKIGVETSNGVVSLSGTVPTTAEKVRAEEVAKEVEGVSKIVNNIMVDPDSIGATNATEKFHETAESAGEIMSDAVILTEIKSQLLAQAIIGTNVDVTDGKVVIKGEVESAQERKKAEEIAKKTDGVKSVKNELVVRKS